MKKALFAILAIFLMLPSSALATYQESPDIDTNPASYHVEWHSQSDWPVLQTEEITTAWVKFTNTGTATWYNYGDHPVRLGTSHDQDRNSDFYKHTWLSANRPAKLKESKVEPGEVGTFEFYLKAPITPGTYDEYFQPVVEGITWMEDWGVFLRATVEGDDPIPETDANQSGYHALWHSQSDDTITMTAGEYTSVWVKFTNTGDTNWYNTGSYPIHLGTDHSRDRSSSFYKHTWLSANRAASMKESVVKPGEKGTFEFYLLAPDNSGTYREYFTPVAEGLTWIGNNGVYWDITVTNESNNDTPESTGDFDLTGYYSESDGKVKLFWDEYSSLQTSTSSDIDGYKIVRSTTSTSPVYPDDWWVYVTGQDTTSYYDTSTSAGNTYYYRVGAYKSGEGVIKYTNHITVEIPSNPTNNNETPENITLSYNNHSNGLQLNWNTYPNVDGYKLLKSETDSLLTYPEDGYYKYITGQSSYSYIDTNVYNNRDYYFRIGAYDNGNIVAYSNTIHVYYENSNAVIENFELSVDEITNALQLTWGEYTENNISGYKILRSTSDSNLTYPEDGYYKYISNPGATSYIDYNVNPSTRYYYRVAAYYNGSALDYTNTVEINYN